MKIGFTCRYCGEILATDHDDGVISSDEFHDCFGERVGYIGEVAENNVYLNEDIEIEILK